MGTFSGRTVHAKFHSLDSSRCKSAPSPTIDLSLPMENEGLLSSTRSTEMSLKTIQVQLCYHLSILMISWTSLMFKKLNEEWTLQQCKGCTGASQPLLHHRVLTQRKHLISFHANWTDRVSHGLFRMYMLVSFYAINISIQQILSLFVLSMCS